MIKPSKPLKKIYKRPSNQKKKTSPKISMESNIMKYLIVLLALVYAGLSEYGVGQVCNSEKVFTISSFTPSPYPPNSCSPQSVTMVGTFQSDATVDYINIHEVYNQRQQFDQRVNINQNFNQGPNTFTFNINTFQCNPGNYFIQVTLQSSQRALACWEYSYYLA